MGTGYSKPLKREALARAADSQTDAILYLLSPEVQEEIDTLITCVETSTLDVERKHVYDRRIEKHEVCSVAKASRDSIIRMWRTQKCKVEESKQSQKVRSKRLRARHTNLFSLAVKRKPSLLPQARGRLFGAKKPANKRQMARLRAGVTLKNHSEALRAFVDEHRESLAAELEEVKEAARRSATELSFNSSCPATQSDFCKWISQNETRWKEAVQRARNGARKQVNVRLTPEAGSQRAAPGRLAPARPRSELKWRTLLSNGFFALALKDVGRITLFAVSCGGRQACMLVTEVVGRGFRLAASINLASLLKPLEDAVPKPFLERHQEVKVYSVAIECTEFVDNAYYATPWRSLPVAPTTRRKREASPAREDSLSECSEESASASSSPGRTLASTDDSEIEEHPGSDAVKEKAAKAGTDSAHSDSSEQAEVARAPAGTHIAWGNEYFKLVDNRNYPDCLMRVADRWLGAEHLGGHRRAKCVRPSRYGETRNAPEVTYLVLKAWMLWRMEWNGCQFLQGSRARLEAWLREARALRHQISRIGAALPAAARREIEELAPAVLSAGLPWWPPPHTPSQSHSWPLLRLSQPHRKATPGRSCGCPIMFMPSVPCCSRP